jgi:hypothetical protein
MSTRLITGNLKTRLQNNNTIPSLNLSFEGMDENTMINQIQKLDSVHDFGGTRGNNLATDTLSKKREDISNSFYYDQMRLFFIQKYSFNNPSLNINYIPIQNFSNFSYPGAGQIPRIVDDVENYCFLLSIKHGLANGLNWNDNFQFQELKDTKNVGSLRPIKSKLVDFLSNYMDNSENGTNKINLIVDTPGDVSKILKSDPDNRSFAYIFTQESAHDSAKGKPTTLDPKVINDTYQGNGFCEAFVGEDVQVRTYTSGLDVSQFESNYDIQLTGMNYNKERKEYFFTNVSYKKDTKVESFPCILNSLVHPTNVPQITKDVNKFTNSSSLPINDTTKNLLTVNKNINSFYTNFKDTKKPNEYDYRQENSQKLDFNFTKKRAGDGLQARVTQMVNSPNYPGLKCYKMVLDYISEKYRDNNEPVVKDKKNIKGGLNTEKVYIIRKLVLVTIDRVLFSYCVKNKIPAIYSGTNFILSFKPSDSALKQSIFTSPNIKQTQPLYEKEPTETISGNKYGKDIKFGGDDVDEVANIFTEIPFSLYKLIPRLIKALLSSKVQNKEKNYQQFMNLYDIMEDNNIITSYGNDKNCIFCSLDLESGDGTYTLDNDYKIYLPGLIKIYKKDRRNDFEVENIEGFTLGTTSFDTSLITTLIVNSDMVLTRSKFQDIDIELIKYYLSEQNEESVVENMLSEQRGGTLDNETVDITTLKITNNPKLNAYIKFFYNSQLSLDTSNLATNNFIALACYLNIMDRYEINMCFDNDKYYQDFNKVSEKFYEVTNKISLYVFFKFLLEDFERQKNNICYGLLEYFINEGDNNKNYFEISDDLETQIYYIYCDEIVRRYTVSEVLTNAIQDGKIDSNDTIFINTKTYFENLINRVNEKTRQVNDYLYYTSGIDNTELNNFIKTYLNMYGFMNMRQEFIRLVEGPEGPESDITSVARGIPGLSTEERLKRIEEQQARAATAVESEQPKQAEQLFKPFQSVQKTALDVATFSDGDMSNTVRSKMSTNIGRGGKTIRRRKKHKKHVKTIKNRTTTKRKNNTRRKHRKNMQKKYSRRK